MRFLAFLFILLAPGFTLAEVIHLDDAGVLPPQPASMVPGMPSAAPASAVASVPVVASAPAIISEAVLPIGLPDVVPTAVEVKQIVDTYPVIKDVIQTPTVFGICSAVALVVNLLIAFLRRRGNLANRKKVKQFLLFAVALAGGLAAVTPGMPLAMVAFVAVAPLLAVVGHEFFKKSE